MWSEINNCLSRVPLWAGQNSFRKLTAAVILFSLSLYSYMSNGKQNKNIGQKRCILKWAVRNTPDVLMITVLSSGCMRVDVYGGVGGEYTPYPLKVIKDYMRLVIIIFGVFLNFVCLGFFWTQPVSNYVISSAS